MLKSTFAKRAALVAALMLTLLLFTGCVGGPSEVSWGSLSLYGSPQTILFAFGDRIVMIDPLDGNPIQLRDSSGAARVDDTGNPRLWEITSPAGAATKFFTAPIPLDDDTLLVVSYDRGIFEVDVPSARINNPTGYAVNGLVTGYSLMADELLYVPLSSNSMTARTVNGFGEAWRLTTRQSNWAQPLLVEDTLYLSSLDHSLYAMNPESGEVLWEAALGGAMTSSPVYADGYLYVGTFGRKLLKLDPQNNGQIVASYDTHDWVWGSPALVDGTLYFGDVSGWLYAVTDDGDTFTPVWEPVQVATRAIIATPVVTDQSIIVGSRDHNLFWVNRDTGAVEITRQMQGEVLGNLLLIQPSEENDLSRDLVVVSTMNAAEFVVAYSADNGERVWVYSR
ncbi:MAG: PQQ-binding-like beta-propeller repeat protein [Anaerolineae bacterium]|nr:PQQ-binding-like beta-propeller repeat protein [Anaerolineae bacterium]